MEQTEPAPLSPQEIARRLKAARVAKGWDAGQLAAEAGVSRNVVIRELEQGIERDRNPVTLARLALALGQPWDYLGAAPPPTVVGRGRALMAARLAKGWTIDDLAARSRVGRATIHNLEHGRSPGNPRTWADLAEVLGADL